MPGPGALLTVPPILRPPSRVGLLAAIEQTGGAQVPESETWLNGITYRSGEGCAIDLDDSALPFGCGITDDGEVGDPQETPTKDSDTDSDISTTYPFLTYLFDECSTFGWEANEYVARVRRAYEACESAIVEYEVWTGLAIQSGYTDYGQAAPVPDQWLASSNATLVDADVLPPSSAIAALEDGLTGCCGEGGFIHIPYSAAELLQARGLLVKDRNILRTVLGTVIVPGKGYPGTSDTNGAADDGATWLYATGPMRYWRTPEVVVNPTTFAEALIRNGSGQHLNSLRFYAERAYLVDFDRCCHFSVQMNLADVAAA